MAETFEEKCRRESRLSQGAPPTWGREREAELTKNLFMRAKKILVPQRNVTGIRYCSLLFLERKQKCALREDGLGGSQVETLTKLVETECDG